MITKVFIARAKITADGARYRVTRENGDTLIESTKNPEFDACRAFLAEGITGTLEVWRHGKSHPDWRLDIENGARWTVSEPNSGGVTFRKWRPFQAETGSEVEEAA